MEIIIDSISNKTYTRYQRPITKEELKESLKVLIEKIDEGYINREILEHQIDTNNYQVIGYSEMIAEIARNQSATEQQQINQIEYFWEYLTEILRINEHNYISPPKDGLSLEIEEVQNKEGVYQIEITQNTKTRNNKNVVTYVEDGVELTEEEYPQYYL